MAKTPEQFSYDDDGNLLSDGRFNYTWDSENRLISAETLTNLPASVPRVKVEFAYDYMSRRVGKTVYNWVSNDWSLIETRGFIYDSWNLISEICNHESQITTNTYVHGLDLSGSLQGAGGIGGLLVARLGTNNACYTYDANGNVSELADASSGELKAHYEYDAFGNCLVSTGPLATENPFRFSTKSVDDESGLSYYGFRYYSPSLGRFLSRDPITEKGLFVSNLSHSKIRIPLTVLQDYAFCRNSSPNLYDILGLEDPCQIAKDTSMDYGHLGGVVCYKGQKYACVWIENAKDVGNDQAKNIVSQCAMNHENTHMPGVVCPPCGLSRGGVPSSGAGASECAGYTAELNCLNNANCNGDENCQRQVEQRRKDVEALKKEFCSKK